jgi:hypothetical protein
MQGLIYPRRGGIMEHRPAIWCKAHGNLCLVGLRLDFALVIKLVVGLLVTLLALCISSLVGF